MSITYETPPVKPPRKINVRLIGLLVFVSLPLIYFPYVVISHARSHGITHDGNVAEVDLKDMGNFAFDEATGTDQSIPRWYRDLDGKRVRLKGFMFVRGSAAPDVSRFEFVYNVAKCCFNGPPLVQERVYVNVPDGTYPYVSDFVAVTGTLHVKVVRHEGAVQAVYTMDAEGMEPVRG